MSKIIVCKSCNKPVCNECTDQSNRDKHIDSLGFKEIEQEKTYSIDNLQDNLEKFIEPYEGTEDFQIYKERIEDFLEYLQTVEWIQENEMLKPIKP